MPNINDLAECLESKMTIAVPGRRRFYPDIMPSRGSVLNKSHVSTAENLVENVDGSVRPKLDGVDKVLNKSSEVRSSTNKKTVAVLSEKLDFFTDIMPSCSVSSEVNRTIDKKLDKEVNDSGSPKLDGSDKVLSQKLEAESKSSESKVTVAVPERRRFYPNIVPSRGSVLNKSHVSTAENLVKNVDDSVRPKLDGVDKVFNQSLEVESSINKKLAAALSEKLDFYPDDIMPSCSVSSEDNRTIAKNLDNEVNNSVRPTLDGIDKILESSSESSKTKEAAPAIPVRRRFYPDIMPSRGSVLNKSHVSTAENLVKNVDDSVRPKLDGVDKVLNKSSEVRSSTNKKTVAVLSEKLDFFTDIMPSCSVSSEVNRTIDKNLDSEVNDSARPKLNEVDKVLSQKLEAESKSSKTTEAAPVIPGRRRFYPDIMPSRGSVLNKSPISTAKDSPHKAVFSRVVQSHFRNWPNVLNVGFSAKSHKVNDGREYSDDDDNA